MFSERMNPPDKKVTRLALPVLIIIFVMRGRSGGGSAPYFFTTRQSTYLRNHKSKKFIKRHS